MQIRHYVQIATLVVATILCFALVQAWRADRRDRAQLAAELATTKQLLTQADARQRDRDAQLNQTLAALAEQKRALVTPAQILRELPKEIPLPAPITLEPDQTAPLGARFSASPSASASADGGALLAPQAPAGAFIPRSDLKPLYDFTLDCQACQAKLSAAQGDLADERQKTAALTKERDDALRVVKGGSTWQRVGRAAKWFLIGAAAGAVLAKTQTR